MRPRFDRQALWGYAFAIIAVMVALGLRLAFAPWLGETWPLLFFFPAVLLAAWFGGVGPGLFAMGLSALAANYFILHDVDGLGSSPRGRFARLSLFAVQTLLLIPLITGLRDARRRAEESAQGRRSSEEQFHRLLAAANEGICMLDAYDRIQFSNHRLGEMLGYSAEEMQGSTLFDFMDEPSRAEAKDRMERRRLGIEERFDRHCDFRFLCKDGSEFWGIVSTTPILDENNQLKGTLGMVTDVTARKRAEQELENLLEREREARAEAQAANLAKDQFLAVLSHELRTPLMPVLVSVSALLDEVDTPDEIRSVLELTARNVELEARLIDDLLDVTRISQGKLQVHREMVDAHALINQAVGICRNDIVAGDIQLDLDLSATSTTVEADPARLQQVFWNLIKNAVKFTPPAGSLTIRSFNAPGADGSELFCVEVKDTGIGIDPGFLPRVFDAFQQGTAHGRQFGGLGLGLAISRWVAEAHGGRLSAASAGLHQGATFHFEMPTAAPLPMAQPVAQPAGSAVYDSPSLRILLAEDNADTLKVMARLLRQRGHFVSTASTLGSALEIAKIQEFDLVVSDIGLPDGSGLDLMRQIRATQEVKGIALSGYGMEDDVKKSREAGFIAHLTKPIDARLLDETIVRVVHGQPVDSLAS